MPLNNILERPRIVHYQRMRRPNANFSLEFIFEDVRQRLADRFDIQVVTAPKISSGLSNRLAIIRHAIRNQGDLTHVTGDITFAVLGLRKCRSILTILDAGILRRTSGIKRRLLKKIWFDLPLQYASFVTTISNSSAQDLRDLCSFDSTKLHVIPVAISDRFRYSPKEFPRERPRLLQIGTAPNKNIERLIAAISNLDVELTIIGKLDTRQTELLGKSGVRYRNQLNLSDDEITEQYIQSDIVCFASTHEGFGMPILEAQATGRPVVTSNCASMPEVAGEAAIFVDPFSIGSIRNGIEKAIGSYELRQFLVAKGLDNVNRFSADLIAQQYGILYNRLLGNLRN